jgi:hypothetical protein
MRRAYSEIAIMALHLSLARCFIMRQSKADPSIPRPGGKCRSKEIKKGRPLGNTVKSMDKMKFRQRPWIEYRDALDFGRNEKCS